MSISSDGTTVVGRTTTFDRAWRWNAGSGLITLTGAPAGLSLDAASDVSQDGTTIVGTMNNGVGTFAYRWTAGAGIQRVVGIGGGGSFGPFVSADGSTIVGTHEGSTLSARRWTQATGAQPLGPVTGLPFGNGSALLGYGVSSDGSVIVGPAEAVYQTSPFATTVTPFRWTAGGGAVGILDNGQFYNPLAGAGASSVSADGSVMVGYSGTTAWRWSSATGFQPLVTPPPIAGTFVPSISGDGATVAYREFLWTQTGGTQTLTDVLTSAGCTFTGWTGLRVIDTSFNGRALCGYGTNPTGQTEAWYATIPAPGAGALLAAAASLTTRRRRA